MAVTWLPFELHPELPPEGVPRERYLPTAARAMDGRLVAMAADVGLVMRHRARMVNSRLALRASEFARERGAFDQVHHALFRAHWDGPGWIDDLEELKRVVGGAGLDPAELEAALADGRYEREVDEVRAEAGEMGINAVPAHVFGGRYLVLGAQSDSVYHQVLDKLASEAS